MPKSTQTLPKVPNAPIIAEIPAHPPLKSRVQINRENAQNSTGPKTPQGKIASRQNSLNHGLSAQVALPREIMVEVADHFWQLANAYCPTNAIAVNAILELTMCAWKNRRLFEQFAGNQARSKISHSTQRISKNQRLAQHWFQKVQIDPPKAIIKLIHSQEGLDLLIQAAQNLLDELRKPNGDGFWTVNQLHLALALKGFRSAEVWNQPEIREFWACWMAIHPDKNTCINQCNDHTNVEREYHRRISETIKNRPAPDRARETLDLEMQILIADWSEKLSALRSVEHQLQTLDSRSAGWPQPHEAAQNLLHLRYSTANDRKTRELHALLQSFPSHENPSDWMFDQTMLPPDWRAVLMNHNDQKNPQPTGSDFDNAIDQIYNTKPKYKESIDQSILRNAISHTHRLTNEPDGSENQENNVPNDPANELAREIPALNVTETPILSPGNTSRLISPMLQLGKEMGLIQKDSEQTIQELLMQEYDANQAIRNQALANPTTHKPLILEKFTLTEPILFEEIAMTTPELSTASGLDLRPPADLHLDRARPKRHRKDLPRPGAPLQKPSQRRKSIAKLL